jgi:ribose 5-phosphate isomerase B
MKIALASDHAGLKLKKFIAEFLEKEGYELKDFGTYSEESCDYPDFAYPAARAVAAGEFDRGIFICGSGVGVTIVANKVNGIRAVNAYDESIARQSREHGDCNVLCLGQNKVTEENAKKIIEIWLYTPFSGDIRHLRRVKKIDNN